MVPVFIEKILKKNQKTNKQNLKWTQWTKPAQMNQTKTKRQNQNEKPPTQSSGSRPAKIWPSTNQSFLAV